MIKAGGNKLKRILIVILAAILLTACGQSKKENKTMNVTVDEIIERYENNAGYYEDVPIFLQVFEAEGFYYMGDYEFMIFVNENKEVEDYTIKTEKPNKEVLDLMRTIAGIKITADYEKTKKELDEWENEQLPEYGFFETFESDEVKMYVTYDGEKFSVSVNPI